MADFLSKTAAGAQPPGDRNSFLDFARDGRKPTRKKKPAKQPQDLLYGQQGGRA